MLVHVLTIVVGRGVAYAQKARDLVGFESPGILSQSIR